MASIISTAFVVVKPDLGGFEEELRGKLKTQIGKIGVADRTITVRAAFEKGTRQKLIDSLGKTPIPVLVAPKIAPGSVASLRKEIQKQLGAVPVGFAPGSASAAATRSTGKSAAKSAGEAAAAATPEVLGLAEATDAAAAASTRLAKATRAENLALSELQSRSGKVAPAKVQSLRGTFTAASNERLAAEQAQLAASAQVEAAALAEVETAAAIVATKTDLLAAAHTTAAPAVADLTVLLEAEAAAAEALAEALVRGATATEIKNLKTGLTKASAPVKTVRGENAAALARADQIAVAAAEARLVADAASAEVRALLAAKTTELAAAQGAEAAAVNLVALEQAALGATESAGVATTTKLREQTLKTAEGYLELAQSATLAAAAIKETEAATASSLVGLTKPIADAQKALSDAAAKRAAINVAGVTPAVPLGTDRARTTAAEAAVKSAEKVAATTAAIRASSQEIAASATAGSEAAALAVQKEAVALDEAAASELALARATQIRLEQTEIAGIASAKEVAALEAGRQAQVLGSGVSTAGAGKVGSAAADAELAAANAFLAQSQKAVTLASEAGLIAARELAIAQEQAALGSVEQAKAALRAEVGLEGQASAARATARAEALLRAAQDPQGINPRAAAQEGVRKSIALERELIRLDRSLATAEGEVAAAIRLKVAELTKSSVGLEASNRAQLQSILLSEERAAALVQEANADATRTSQAIRGAGATGATFLGLRGAVLSSSAPFLLATAAAIGFAKTIGTASQLEQSLNVFQATAGATAAQMELVSRNAKTLGADLSLPATSANDAAAAMTELAKAGLSVNNAIAASKGVLQLSTAANISVVDAAKIVATELNAFNLAGSDATRVADLLAGASKEAQGEITDFALAFQQVSAVANQVGLPLETTTALLTQFAKAGLRGCYDDKTDVLTRAGWKSWADVTMEDEFATVDPGTGQMEYQLPERLVRYRHTGKMYEVRNSHVDLCVTPDHRMWVKRGSHDHAEFKVLTAEEVYGKSVQYQAAVGWDGVDDPIIALPEFDQPRGGRWIKTVEGRTIAAEDWAAFMGYYLSEGSCDYRRGNYRISIAQRPGEKRDKMLADITRLGFKVTENKRALTICSEQLFRSVCDIGHAAEKRVPREILNWSSRLLRIFYKAFQLGDGSADGRLYTSSIGLRDDLMETILKCGWATKHRLRMPVGKQSVMSDGRTVTSRYEGWCVSANQSHTSPMFDNSPAHASRREDSDRVYERWIDYDGEVFCATVPNHLLVVRRNGNVVVSGNSDAGTSLRTLLLRLVPTTKAAAEAQASLGISLDKSLPSGAQFINLVDQYTAALAKLGPIAQQEALTQIFGQDAIRGASISLTKGSASLVALQETVSKAGLAAEITAGRTKGLAGATAGLKSQVETLAATMGTALLPTLTSIAQTLSDIAGTANSAADALGKLGKAKVPPLGISAQDVGGALGGGGTIANVALALGAGFGIKALKGRRDARKLEAAEAKAAAAAVLATEKVAATETLAAWEVTSAGVITATQVQTAAQVSGAERAAVAQVAAARLARAEWLASLTAIQRAQLLATTATGRLTGLLKGNAGLAAGIVGTVAGQAIQGDGSSGTRNEIGGLVSGAAQGAVIGSIIPGVGTAVGAAGGALLGAITTASAERKKAKDKWDAISAEDQWAWFLKEEGQQEDGSFATPGRGSAQLALFGFKLKPNPFAAQAAQAIPLPQSPLGLTATSLVSSKSKTGEVSFSTGDTKFSGGAIEDFLKKSAADAKKNIKGARENAALQAELALAEAELSGDTKAADAAIQTMISQTKAQIDRAKRGLASTRGPLGEWVIQGEEREKLLGKVIELTKKEAQLYGQLSSASFEVSQAAQIALIRAGATEGLADDLIAQVKIQKETNAALAEALKEGDPEAIKNARIRKEGQDATVKGVEGNIKSKAKADAKKAKEDAEAAAKTAVQNAETRLRIAADAAGNIGAAENKLIAFLKKQANDSSKTTAEQLAAQQALTSEIKKRQASLAEIVNATVGLRDAKLQTRLALAELTATDKDNIAVFNAQIANDRKDILRLQKLADSSSTTAQQRIDYLTQIQGELQDIARLEGQIKSAQGGSGFSIEDLFKEALNQFNQFASNVSTSVTTPGGVRGAIGGAIAAQNPNLSKADSLKIAAATTTNDLLGQILGAVQGNGSGEDSSRRRHMTDERDVRSSRGGVGHWTKAQAQAFAKVRSN